MRDNSIKIFAVWSVGSVLCSIFGVLLTINLPISWEVKLLFLTFITPFIVALFQWVFVLRIFSVDWIWIILSPASRIGYFLVWISYVVILEASGGLEAATGAGILIIPLAMLGGVVFGGTQYTLLRRHFENTLWIGLTAIGSVLAWSLLLIIGPPDHSEYFPLEIGSVSYPAWLEAILLIASFHAIPAVIQGYALAYLMTPVQDATEPHKLPVVATAISFRKVLIAVGALSLGIAAIIPYNSTYIFGMGCKGWYTSDFYENADIAVIEECLKKGSRTYSQNLSTVSASALHFAAGWSSDPKIIHVLIQAGEDPNSTDNYYMTPLHYAAINSVKPAIIDVLVSAGANPNAKDKYGQTPLHIAVIGPRAKDKVEVLFKAGADVNAKDTKGQTPLEFAVNHPTISYWKNKIIETFSLPQVEAVSALLNAGANTDVVKDNSNFQHIMGMIYGKGIGVAEDKTAAVKWYKLSAEQGNAEDQTNLGYMYEIGQGVPQDDAEAARWYRKAADQYYARAQTNLGYMYSKGRGVKQDYAEALKWYRRASSQGYARAQTNLGYMYANGRGVKQDDAEAVKWYRKAADQGYARAQTNLGYMYEIGQGVPQDDAEAARWYRKAADQYYARAQNNLGVRYQKGQGVAQNYKEALRLYRLAAKQGHATGQLNLAKMYKNGTGISRDLDLALMWLTISATNGSEKAIEFMTAVENSQFRKFFPDVEQGFTLSQIAEAKKRSEMCIKSSYQDCD